ncbi:hypothetical protein [Psychroflexus halocasei]|uniref:Uncharacterized protein n=1 Tax=Psychroflexus halocasei TaxID=908615 RepID=A0A1H4DTK2_9FLAO|nr:hypothetical protein [Psychroflexus halocasei]SEA75522.1 hypothetical protein SAMN05421540_11415 [Psychroflexus halocasei]
MKQKLLRNSFWKFHFTLFCSLLCLTSCQKDDGYVETEKTEKSIFLNQPTEKIVSWKTFQQNSKLINKINEVKSVTKESSISLQRGVYSEAYDFTIDTSYANYIEFENYHSFTFPVYRNYDSESIENLVLSLQDDGSYKAILMAYELSESDIEKIQTGEYVNLEHKISSSVINLNFMNISTDQQLDCELEDVQVYVKCSSGKHHQGNWASWGECTADQRPRMYITQQLDCNAGGGSSGGGSTGGGSTGGGSGDPFPGNTGGDGSGSGSGTGNDNTQDPNENPENENPENEEPEECLELTEGSGCANDITKPVLKVKTQFEKECEELQINSSDTTFKERMNNLKSATLGDTEKSFGIYNGNYVDSTYPNPSCGAVVEGDEQNAGNIPFHTSLKAIAHNHLKNATETRKHIGTFSPNDLIALSNLAIDIEANNSPVKKQEIATYLVCDEGNYSLKINDIYKLYNFALKYGTDNAFKDIIDEFYERNNIAHGEPKNDQNIGFLKLLKNFDIGANFYEADNNFENWEKLELNLSENDINKKSC